METSDMIYKSWDFDRRGTTVLINDAIKVEDPQSENQVVEPTKELIEESDVEPLQKEKPVPDWVKSNAKWWSEGQIDDQTFTNGIGFLIAEEIIDVPVKPNIGEIKKDDIDIQEEEEPKLKVPEWVKSNAKWWSEGQIDESTFLSGIEFMVKEGIIVVVPG